MNHIMELESISDVESPVASGEVIDGKYRVSRVLGAGGMGVVVAATHLLLERPIAIKFMSPLLAGNDMGVRRFMLEARAAARIQSEHVARVFDVAALPDGTPYIVMEYLEGWDLEHLLVKRGRLPLKEAVGYVLEACEAIAEAHAAGIVHRDLKPGNLFLGTRPDGSPLVKVLDFGVSKLLPSASRALRDEVKTGPHVVMGSPLYSSPEQLRAASGVDARSDIWALGAILYEMLAGEPPFVAETFVEACAKIAHSPFRPLCKRRPDLPPGIDAVLAGALAKTPEDRFPSVADFARELGAFASDRATLLVERIVNVARRATQGGTLADTLPSRTDPSLALPPFVASTTLTRPRKSERPGARWWVLSGVVATALFAWLVFGLPRAPAPPVLSAGTAPVTPAPLSAVPVTTTRAVDAPLEPRPQVSQEPPIATPQRQPAPTVQTATTPQRRPRSREGRPPDTAGFGGLQ